MKTSYLFIGGDLDGQHVEIDPHAQNYWAPVERLKDYPPTQSGDFKDEPFEMHHYVMAWVGNQKVFLFNGDLSLLIDRYPLAGTINVNLEDLETILETCEPPMIPTARPRFDLAVRRLYTALSNHNKQKDQ